MNERIEELLFDDHQIVTYKSLCIHLDISASKAKRALEEYIKNSDDSNISVVYLLSGRTKTGLAVILVRDVDLEETKLKLTTIHHYHPYSVQKQKLSSPQVLYSHDYDLMKNNRQLPSSYSNIKYLGGSVISNAPAQSTTSRPEEHDDPNKNLFAERTVKKSPTNQKDFFKKSSSKGEKKTSESKAKKTEAKKEDTAPPASKLESKSSKKVESKKQGGMKAFMTSGKTNPFESSKKTAAKSSTASESASKKKQAEQDEMENEEVLDEELAMLAAAAEEDEEFQESKETSTNNKKGTNKKKESTRKDSPPSKKVSTDKPISTTPTKEKGALKKNTKNTESPSSGKENVPADDEPTEKPKEKPSSKSKSKKKSRSNSQELPAAKKRKRIMELDSSSDEESDHGEMDVDDAPPLEAEKDLILASPPQEKKSSIKTTTSNRRKKRVLKSRTYVDDEGCMLTEKTWEEVSCSSEDEVIKSRDKNVIAGTPKDALKSSKPTKTSTAFSKKAVGKPAKTKQSSLMGFFSKKPPAKK